MTQQLIWMLNWQIPIVWISCVMFFSDVECFGKRFHHEGTHNCGNGTSHSGCADSPFIERFRGAIAVGGVLFVALVIVWIVIGYYICKHKKSQPNREKSKDIFTISHGRNNTKRTDNNEIDESIHYSTPTGTAQILNHNEFIDFGLDNPAFLADEDAKSTKGEIDDLEMEKEYNRRNQYLS